MDLHSKTNPNQLKQKHPGTTEPSLVDVDSPDDMMYEGKFNQLKTTRELDSPRPFVTVDNPDDFE